MPNICIISIAKHIDYKSLYELQLQINAIQKNENGEQSETIISLRLQLLELQKFIFSGKQEKFKLNPDSNPLQTTLFDKDKLGEVVIESIQHVAAHEIKKTVIRVKHPGRRPLSENIRREEIRLMPTEDVTGLIAVGEEITEILEYKQGELYVKNIFVLNILNQPKMAPRPNVLLQGYPICPLPKVLLERLYWLI